MTINNQDKLTYIHLPRKSGRTRNIESIGWFTRDSYGKGWVLPDNWDWGKNKAYPYNPEIHVLVKDGYKTVRVFRKKDSW